MAVDRQRAEDGLQELTIVYRDAQRVIAAQVREAIKEQRLGRRSERLAAFQRVTRYLDSIGVASDPIARQLIENAWTEGDLSILRKTQPNAVGYPFSVVNREAMEEVQQALVTSLGDARATVGRQVFDIYRRAGLRSTAMGLLGARGSRRGVSEDMVKRLTERGIKSFTDKAGRQWQLKHYAEMVARTTTREAVVAAQIQRMSAAGINFARVSSNGSKCSICGPMEGLLVALGAGREFDGESAMSLDAMDGGPPFHPNCRHWLDPVAEMFA